MLMTELNRAMLLMGIIPLMIVAVMAHNSQSGDMPDLPESQVMVQSAYDFSDTVELLTAAIEEQNLMVVKTIDAQKMLKMVNKQVGGMKQLLFFHPRYMKRIIETNPLGTIEPPFKIAIMERPDGGVVVKYIKPSSMLGKYSGLEELGVELDGIVGQIATSVLP